MPKIMNIIDVVTDRDIIPTEIKDILREMMEDQGRGNDSYIELCDDLYEDGSPDAILNAWVTSIGLPLSSTLIHYW